MKGVPDRICSKIAAAAAVSLLASASTTGRRAVITRSRVSDRDEAGRALRFDRAAHCVLQGLQRRASDYTSPGSGSVSRGGRR